MQESRPAARTVGILGGMGPEATVDLMQRIIRLTPAQDDADHVRMLVDNNPRVPSRIAALIEGTGSSPAPTLRAMAEGLVAQGADFLAMPCNTVHHYHAEVAAGLPVPFLNMVELAAAALAKLDPRIFRVGLLASSALRKIELYEPYLAAQGMQVLYPGAVVQESLMALIRAIKAQSVTPEHRAAFGAAAADLEGAGADVLLIACTELSLVDDELETGLPVYDAAEILSEAIAAAARTGPA
jgi:aspartate racemase